MYNFSPFSVKVYTNLVLQGGNAQENFVFGELNIHNFRSFFSLDI